MLTKQNTSIDHTNKRKFHKYPFKVMKIWSPNLLIFTKKCALHFLVDQAARLHICLKEKNRKKRDMIKKVHYILIIRKAPNTRTHCEPIFIVIF